MSSFHPSPQHFQNAVCWRCVNIRLNIRKSKAQIIIDLQTQDETIKRELMLTLLLDDLFMPAPEYFIHTCYPDVDTWQLLPHDCTIRSRAAFLQISCIFPAFFKLGLKLESDTGSILSSSTGKCELDFICSHTNDNRLFFWFYLQIDHDWS